MEVAALVELPDVFGAANVDTADEDAMETSLQSLSRSSSSRSSSRRRMDRTARQSSKVRQTTWRLGRVRALGLDFACAKREAWILPLFHFSKMAPYHVLVET